MVDCNLRLSFNGSPDMNTTHFQEAKEDIYFEDSAKVLRMNGRYSNFIFIDNYRKSENYIKGMTNCIILDFDNGYTREEFKKKANFAYAIGTTKSHNKNKNGKTCERFRVIIPTETAISLDSNSYADLMLGVFDIFPGADKACKDTARAYSGYINSEVDLVYGEYFDWEKPYKQKLEQKEIIRRWDEKERKTKIAPEMDGTKSDWYRENWLSDKMRDKLRFEEKFAGGRNNTIYSIARYFKEDVQLTSEEIIEAVHWMNTQDLPEMEIKSILKGLRVYES